MAIQQKIEQLSMFDKEIGLNQYLDLYKSKMKNAWVILCESKANKDPKADKLWSQTAFRSKQKSEIKEFISSTDLIDLYITANAFGGPQRLSENVAHIPLFILDLDTYKSEKYKHMDPREVFQTLEEKEFGINVPCPNGVVYSGGGIYLVYGMKFTPGTEGTRSKRKVLMKILYELFKPYGADAKSLDDAHVFRPPGTLNGKNGLNKEVKAWFNDLPFYSLKDLQEELPSLWDVIRRDKKIEIEKERKRKGHSSSEILPFFKGRSLASDRVKDIQTIAKIMKYDCEGYRELLLFLLRNYYHWEHKKRFHEGDTDLYLESYHLAMQLNRKFKDPLEEKEIRESTLNTKKLYMYKQKTINDLFDLDLDQQIQLRIKTPEAIRYKDKLRKREERGSVSREDYLQIQQQQTEEKLLQLKVLIRKNPKAKRKELAEKLGVTPQRISQLKKQL
jgi:hypothetical protein